MKTAAEILDEYRPDMGDVSDHHYHWIKIVINEARKQTIIECAERAKAKPKIFFEAEKHFGCPAEVHTVIDKQSILSLINELK